MITSPPPAKTGVHPRFLKLAAGPEFRKIAQRLLKADNLSRLLQASKNRTRYPSASDSVRLWSALLGSAFEVNPMSFFLAGVRNRPSRGRHTQNPHRGPPAKETRGRMSLNLTDELRDLVNPVKALSINRSWMADHF